MKKVVTFLAVFCLLMNLAACSGNQDPVKTEPQNNETQGSAPVGDPNAFYFTYEGTEIRLHADMAPILEKLGEPKKYTESASCAFEGLDKTYFYGNFYMTTYPQGEKDYVFSLWFVDDTLNGLGIVFIEASAQIRPGQIFFLILTPGCHRHQTVFPGKVLRHLGKYRILGRRMVSPKPKLGQGLIAGAGLAHTQSCGSTAFQFPIFLPPHRVFCQIELSQINDSHIFCAASLLPLRRAGIFGMVRTGFHLGGFPHTGQDFRHQGG